MSSFDLLKRIALMPVRLALVAPYQFRSFGRAARWLFASREHTNLTYHLTDLNEKHLAHFIALVCSVGVEEIARYIREIAGDEALRTHIARLSRTTPRAFLIDAQARYGRRVGWYALVRTIKPRVVIETGVDKGLGSCVIAAALLRNAAEGAPGFLYGTDINPKAGFFVQEPYDACAKVLYGDSIESIVRFEEEVDLFINDSDHSADYEAREYDAVAPRLSASAVIVGDNAHYTDSLMVFAAKTGRRFAFFREEPRDHWYPGGGIGIAFGKR